ncbi:MAG: response regulator, partial [Nitrososphaerales archaeon]
MENPQQSASILLVDDDADSLRTFGTLLTDKGYAVEIAETGAEAIEKTKGKKFDLALIDITLPDVEGTRLLGALGAGSDMRKIMVSGKATVENAVDSLNRGAHAFLMKPVDPENLLRIIDEQLRVKVDESLVTQDRLSHYIDEKRADFISIVKDSLYSLLGESTTKTTIFHLGGEKTLGDPEELEANLRTLFDSGAETVL